MRRSPQTTLPGRAAVVVQPNQRQAPRGAAHADPSPTFPEAHQRGAVADRCAARAPPVTSTSFRTRLRHWVASTSRSDGSFAAFGAWRTACRTLTRGRDSWPCAIAWRTFSHSLSFVSASSGLTVTGPTPLPRMSSTSSCPVDRSRRPLTNASSSLHSEWQSRQSPCELVHLSHDRQDSSQCPPWELTCPNKPRSYPGWRLARWQQR